MQKKYLQEGQLLYIIATVVFAAGILFAVISNVFHLRFYALWPCMLKEVGHLYCPGCGGTRAVYLLFRLRLVESIMSNPFVFYFAFLFLYYYIGTTLAVINKGRRIYFHFRIWMVAVAGIILLWTMVGRNVLAIFFGIDYLGEIVPYWRY